MANIRLDLQVPIEDGQTLTFKSPIDCSKVTGLIIYYPENDSTTSKVFQFADAHGNNVGGKGLFVENVLVKVILDTESSRAYVQNADTNAYLEGKLAEKYSPENKPTPADIGAAAVSDVAKTATKGISNSSVSYVKISNFGAWGTGVWYEKGFSMLLTSRAGETIWVSVSSDDSNTNAKAIRLMNTHSKMAAVYYSASESAVYAMVAAWCNNVNAHILSNVNGDYVPTVEQAAGLPSDAVQIRITEMGPTGNTLNLGHTELALAMMGSGGRPTYNGADVALKSDIVTYGNATSASAGLMSHVDKANLDSLVAKAISVLSGSTEPTSDLGNDGDIYLVTG